MTERVVLDYSGGLDTSVAVPYLAEPTGAEVGFVDPWGLPGRLAVARDTRLAGR